MHEFIFETAFVLAKINGSETYKHIAMKVPKAESFVNSDGVDDFFGHQIRRHRGLARTTNRGVLKATWKDRNFGTNQLYA